MKQIELLNSEGPILIAEWMDRSSKFNADLILVTLLRTDESYLFYKDEFVQYLNGEFIVENNLLGKYSEFRKVDYFGMLPSDEKLNTFLNFK
jgi:hypothetical protein